MAVLSLPYYRKGLEILFAKLEQVHFLSFLVGSTQTEPILPRPIAENEEKFTFIMAGPFWGLIALRARRTHNRRAQSQRACSPLCCSTPAQIDDSGAATGLHRRLGLFLTLVGFLWNRLRRR
jgi:hypothetical protein